MKKIVLSVMTVGAMFFATQNLQAQEEKEVETDVEVEMEQETDEFETVDIISLPQAVKDAVMTDYNEAETKEAWVKTVGEMKVYKLSLDVQGETEEVFVDQDGKWLAKEETNEE